MNNFFNLTSEQRKLVIEQTSAKRDDLFPQIIEKDLWVTTILQLIFSFPFADKIVFKGGTSTNACQPEKPPFVRFGKNDGQGICHKSNYRRCALGYHTPPQREIYAYQRC